MFILYMDSENNIDNVALYLFLFLSLLSVGNDVYQVYLTTLETDFIKKQKDKMNNYYEVFEGVLCNNVKKIKNKMILYKKETNQKIDKKEKDSKKENKKEKKRKKKINEDKINEKTDYIKENKYSENNILDEKNNTEYDNNVNILRSIVKRKNNNSD